MTPGCDDDLITCAHALLRALEPDDVPSLASIQVGTLASGIEGTTSNGVIVINKDGEIYHRGDLLALACVLHHEFQHAAKHADERHAYIASMNFCRRHNAPDWLVVRVRREWCKHHQPKHEATP